LFSPLLIYVFKTYGQFLNFSRINAQNIYKR
jgi:hypothetical protein